MGPTPAHGACVGTIPHPAYPSAQDSRALVITLHQRDQPYLPMRVTIFPLLQTGLATTSDSRGDTGLGTNAQSQPAHTGTIGVEEGTAAEERDDGLTERETHDIDKRNKLIMDRIGKAGDLRDAAHDAEADEDQNH